MQFANQFDLNQFDYNSCMMKIENQIDLQKFYQISLNQNMYESDDSKTENKIIDIIRFNIDIVFIM